MLPRKSFITSLFVLLCTPSVQAVTLDEAIRTSLTTNPEVRIAIHERLARDQAIVQARGNYLPTLDLVVDAGRERSDNVSTRSRTGGDITLTRREFEIQATQRLFDGYATKNEVERQTARIESAAHAVMDVSERTALRVVDVYLEVLRRQELLRLSEKNLEAHLSIQDQIRLRAEAGVGRGSDLDQIDSRVALAKANVLADEFNLRDAESNYLRVVDALPIDLARPTAPTDYLPSSLPDAEATAIANHPVLRIADADVDATVAQQKTARNAYYPQFDMQWKFGLGEDLDGIEGDDDELSLLVRARWNLYRGGSDQARVRETAFFVDQAKDIRNRARRQVVESVRLSWVAHEAATARLAPLKRRVVSTEKTRDAYKKQFNIGQRALLDLLDTENEVTDARRTYWNAGIDGQIAQYRVLTGVGRLLQSLDIPPPPESQVSGELSAGVEHADPGRGKPIEPEIVFEDPKTVAAAIQPSVESGVGPMTSSPDVRKTAAYYEADTGPKANTQGLVAADPAKMSPFASLQKTFALVYDMKKTKLAMDLSMFQDEDTSAVAATSTLVAAMWEPLDDFVVSSTDALQIFDSTTLALDRHLPTRAPGVPDAFQNDLGVTGSQE